MSKNSETKRGFKSIRTQLVLTTGVCLIALLTLCSVFIVTRVSGSFRTISNNYLHEMASYYAESTKAIVAHEYATCAALRTSIEQIEAVPPEQRRDFVNEVLRQALVDNETFVDTWVVYEPNALDGLDSEYPDTENHDSTGRAIGVIGLDMSLDTLSSLLKQVTVYDSGYLSLVSNSGLIAVDYDASNEGQILSDFGNGQFALAKNSLQPFGMHKNEGGRYAQILSAV